MSQDSINQHTRRFKRIDDDDESRAHRSHTATRAASPRGTSATKRSRHRAFPSRASVRALSLTRAPSRRRRRCATRGEPSVSHHPIVDARRASAPIDATNDRLTNDARTLSSFRLDVDARARRDDTVTRHDQRRRGEDADAAAKRVEEGCVFVVPARSMRAFDSIRFVRDSMRHRAVRLTYVIPRSR